MLWKLHNFWVALCITMHRIPRIMAVRYIDKQYILIQAFSESGPEHRW